MVEYEPRKHIVFNPRLYLFEYIEFDEKGRFKTIKYSPGEFLGYNEEGYPIYKAFNKYIVFDESTLKVLQVLNYIGLSVTFSIETRGGHQEFAVEITAETLKPTDIAKTEYEIEEEIFNIINKLLYILYDVNKDIPKGHSMKPVAMSAQKRILNKLNRGEIECREIEAYYQTIAPFTLYRDRKVYISQKIIKAGVEYLTGELPPVIYPDVYLIIEQNMPYPRRYETIIRDLEGCEYE